MRKGKRERIEKGSREGIEKETKRQFEEKEGLRETPLSRSEENQILEVKAEDREREQREEAKGLVNNLDKEHRHLPLLVVQLPQGTVFPTRFCSKALQH